MVSVVSVVSVLSQCCASVARLVYKQAPLGLNKDMAKVFLRTQNIFVRIDYGFFFRRTNDHNFVSL